MQCIEPQFRVVVEIETLPFCVLVEPSKSKKQSICIQPFSTCSSSLQPKGDVVKPFFLNLFIPIAFGDPCSDTNKCHLCLSYPLKLSVCTISGATLLHIYTLKGIYIEESKTVPNIFASELCVHVCTLDISPPPPFVQPNSNRYIRRVLLWVHNFTVE